VLAKTTNMVFLCSSV